MAQENIDFGTSARNDGETLFSVFTKIQAMFTEVYAALAAAISATGIATLTNKTIALGSNTISGTTAEFNTALTDGNFATQAGSETLTNKSIDLTSNTLVGSVSEFNAALESADFYTTGGTDVAVADGGSGRSTATAYAVICGGTTDTGAHQSVASLGNSGELLRSNGAGALPSWTAAGAGDVTAASNFGTDNVLVRSDGVNKGVQHTGVSVDDSNNMSGLAATSTTTIELGHASDTTVSRSAAGVIAVEGVPLYSNIPVNSQSAAYTTVLGDAQKFILHPTADNNPRTFTIDSNANVAYPIGTTITFINQINTVTISITSDTLTLAGAGSTGSRTLAASGMATAIKIASTSWIISGAGLT